MVLHNPDEIKKTLYNTKTSYSIMGAFGAAATASKTAVNVGKNASKTSRVLSWISKHKKPIAAWTAGGVGAGLLVSPIGGDITGNVGNSIGGLFGGLFDGFGMIPFMACGASSCVIVIVILMLVLGN